VSGELHGVGAGELARLISTREISPVQAVEASLARIAELDGVLNACTVVLDVDARARASEAERAIGAGEPVGPLHGLPVAVKDAIWVRGELATMGSRALSDFRPTEDAASVRRLRAGGAIVVAKTTNSELLWSGYTATDLYGITRNPWDVRLTPGGSSGGSGAAVASGMVPLALGTDAGGSIRIPAAFCGVVGFKPTHGLVARSPAFEEMRSLNVVGPLARSVADARLCLDVIAGAEPADNLSAPIARCSAPDSPSSERRIAWSLTLGDHPVQEEIGERFHATIARLKRAGWGLHEARPEVGDLGEISMPILLTELAPMVKGREHLLSPALRDLVIQGAQVSARTYFDAQLKRARLTRRFEAFFEDYDALLTPTTAMRPFDADPRGPIEIAGTLVDVDLDTAPYNLTVIANLTGAPAVSLPAGVDRGGLPVGIQVTCRRFADDLCLQIAGQLERLLPLAEPPPLTVTTQGPATNS
jgi:Asp-tRNA(Asn)/Glu-tRNA(Gln) amidotransferase A subunit family amidase